MASKAPSVWLDASDEERSNDFILTTDTCIWKNEHFFVRCSLAIPLQNRSDTFDFGVWSTLSRENFDRYMATFDSRRQGDMEPMFGWFSNQLPGYPPTLNLKCHVIPQDAGLRPLIELEPTDHPLALQQRAGISLEDATAYVHAHLGI